MNPSLLALALLIGACSSTGGTPSPDGGNSDGGLRDPVCTAGTSADEVAAPEFVRNLSAQTSWFASPVVAPGPVARL